MAFKMKGPSILKMVKKSPTKPISGAKALELMREKITYKTKTRL